MRQASILHLSLSLSLSLFFSLSLSFSHHHHVAVAARISLALFRHLSLSYIAPERSPRLHPVSAQSGGLQVLAGRPAYASPCEGVHTSMPLMSSSILLQQCPAYLVRLAWIVLVMGVRSCFVGYRHLDLFNIARSILV